MTLEEAYKLKGEALTRRELAEIDMKRANEVIVRYIKDGLKAKNGEQENSAN